MLPEMMLKHMQKICQNVLNLKLELESLNFFGKKSVKLKGVLYLLVRMKTKFDEIFAHFVTLFF